eukprot:IDg1340t1
MHDVVNAQLRKLKESEDLDIQLAHDGLRLPLRAKREPGDASREAGRWRFNALRVSRPAARKRCANGRGGRVGYRRARKASARNSTRCMTSTTAVSQVVSAVLAQVAAASSRRAAGLSSSASGSAVTNAEKVK